MPLLNRIAAFCGSIVMFCVSIVIVVKAGGQLIGGKARDVGECWYAIVMGLLCAAWSVAMIWLSLRYGRRPGSKALASDDWGRQSLEQMHPMANKKTDAVAATPESAPPMTPEQFQMSAESYVVRCNLANGNYTAIIVDVPNKMIHFVRCHTPRRFFSWPKAAENVVCGFDEIEAYYRSTIIKGPTFLKIVTTSGTATIDRRASGFEELWSWLNANITFNPAAHPDDSPLMVFVDVVAGVVGMIVLPGLFFRLLSLIGLPIQGGHVSDGFLVLIALGFAPIGVVLMHAFVKIVGRVWNTSLVPAIVYGFWGSVCGLILCGWLQCPGSIGRFLGLIAVAVGFVAGVLVGTGLDARSRRSARIRFETRRGQMDRSGQTLTQAGKILGILIVMLALAIPVLIFLVKISIHR